MVIGGFSCATAGVDFGVRRISDVGRIPDYTYVSRTYVTF